MDRERLLAFGDQKQEELAFLALQDPEFQDPLSPCLRLVDWLILSGTQLLLVLPRPKQPIVINTFRILGWFSDLLPSELKPQQTRGLLSKLSNLTASPAVLPLPVSGPSCSAAAVCFPPAPWPRPKPRSCSLGFGDGCTALQGTNVCISES